MQIVPIRDLKDTVKIENLCAEEKGPVFITKNGYGKLVVMEIEYFEKLLNQAFEAKIVNDGLSDLQANKVRDGQQALKDLKKKYGL